MQEYSPSINLYFNREGQGFYIEKNGADFFQPRNFLLSITYENVYPEPFVSIVENKIILIFGNPIVDEKIEKNKLATLLLKNNGDKNLLKKINGEFVIIIVDLADKLLSIVNDRFTSIPLFYLDGNDFLCASTSYGNIFSLARQQPNFQLNFNVFFEFLWFRRIHDDRTYDCRSKFLKSARILTYDGKVTLEKYWEPSFIKDNNRSIEEFSDDLAYRIVASLKRKTSDLTDKGVGLFLSGGMDTRTVLAALCSDKININPVCYTVGYSKCGEYKTSQLVTEQAGTELKFLELPIDYYQKYIDDKIALSNGMFNLFGAIFLGFRERVQEKSDILFHGHGFDYLFQGMYLPCRPVSIFHHSTYFKKIIDINKEKNFPRYYIHNVPHRYRGVDIRRYLQPGKSKRLIDFLENGIHTIAQEGANSCADNFDLWEYVMIHTISRHYSQMDVASIGTNGEQRKVSNDNDIFDLYLKLPKEHRMYAKVMRGALRSLNKGLAQISSANTGFKIDSSPMELTLHFAKMKALRGITRSQKFRHPQAADRTWPDSDEQIVNMPKLRNWAVKLCDSERLREALPYFDFNKIKEDTDNLLAGNCCGIGTFLMNLITIDLFLEKY